MRKTLITILCYWSSHFLRDGGKPFSFFLTMLIFSLSSVNFVLASTYAVESRHQNVHFERTDTIPKGPYPVTEANCKLFTVTDPIGSAKGIKDRGWAVTSDVHYGPFEIVSFAGSLESYGPCVINNTNIAIFHKRKLIGFFYTDPNFDHQLASIRIDSSGAIKIFSGGGLNSLSYEIVFRDNRITLDTPIYKTACEGDGIIPTSNLNIFDKRQELKHFGWRSVTSSPESEQFKDGYELDPFYDTVRVENDLPELVTCGGMYCKFLYETDKSYLDITTTSDNYRVLSYNGFCK